MSSRLLASAAAAAALFVRGHAGPVRDTTTMCVGMATYSAVGPHQAHGKGALFSRTGAFSIEGGTSGTVAVKRGLLGLSKAQLREFGRAIRVLPQDSGALTELGGPAMPFSVSDLGDRDIQDAREVRFDVYRWESRDRADDFGVRKFRTVIVFPTVSGGRCPAGWRIAP